MAKNFDVVIPETNGKPVAITGTDSAGETTIFTSTSTTNTCDEVYMYVSNSSATDGTVTVAIGSTANTGDLVCKDLAVAANESMLIVIPGLRIDNGVTIKAYKDSSSTLNAHLAINRISK